MKTFEDARETLESEGLRMKELTYGGNGSPSFGGKTRLAFYDFGDDEFALCEQLAKEVGGRIELIHWRDGWQLAESLGETMERIYLSDDRYGDDYSEWCDPDAEFIYLKERIEEAKGIDDISTMVAEYEECRDEYFAVQDDEFILTYFGKYVETLPRHAMNWAHDTHNYAVSVVIDTEDFNVEEE